MIKISVIMAERAKMPGLLKWVTSIFIFGGPIFLFLALLPISEWTIGKTKIPFSSFWKLGYGPITVIFSCLMIFIGLGLLERRDWARWSVVLLAYIQDFLFFIRQIFFDDNLLHVSFEDFIFSTIWAFVAFWVLFRSSAGLMWFSNRDERANIWA